MPEVLDDTDQNIHEQPEPVQPESSIDNPETPTTNMEVHHHPDLHHKRKHFKEYFLEFLMIFLAVTMGFFAENIREAISDHHREKQYMQSMLHDLEKDTAALREGLDFSAYVANGLDSLKNMLYSEPGTTNSAELYRLHTTYSRRVNIYFSDQTSSQLKVGGMQLIKNRPVAAAISGYWSLIEALKGVLDNYSGKGANASEIASRIFNYKYVHFFRVDAERRTIMQIDPHAALMVNDPNQLADYANHLFYMINILRTFYSADLRQQHLAAGNLIALIKKEYTLENE